MALRNQPYLPLYVQDYLTDEKLSMCTWETQGVYIKILCLLHKSDPYGTILLKQNDNQTENIALNFANKIIKLLPIDKDILYRALLQLIDEGCLIIDGNKLFQKRMVRDNEISLIREEAGSRGGKKTQLLAKAKIEAKYENDNINENIINNNILESQFEIFRQSYPGTKRGFQVEFDNLKKKHKDWPEIIPILSDALNYQINCRQIKKNSGGFVPEWKNLQTWINQKCWTEEIETNNISNGANKRHNGATTEEIIRAVAKNFPVEGM